MTPVVRVRPVRAILRWAHGLLFAVGFALLGYCGLVFMDSSIFQNRENSQLEHLIAAAHDRTLGISAADAQKRRAASQASLAGLIGRIEIPRLGLSAIVMEGTDRTTLRRAVGHIAGMALPGEPGNVGIAGHRDTFFRPLRNIRQNDIIMLTTLGGEYRYRVVSSQVVGPYDVEMLASGTNEVLTLVTCYPFYFVGSSPDRFIVRAERVRNHS